MIALLLACVPTEASVPVETEDTGPHDYRTHPNDPPENGFQLKTPEFIVEPYQDITMCYYGTYNGESMGINFFEWFQDLHAGHHFMVLIPEDTDTNPDGSFIDCTVPDASEMTGVRPLLQGTNAVSDLNGQMILPEGKAVKLVQGQRWVLQSHYLNTTDQAMLVQDSANFGLIPVEQVDGWVSSFVFNNTSFVLTPGANTLTVDCYWDQSVTLLTLMGHMHTNGTSFSVDAFPNGTAERIYDLPEWNPDWVYNPQVKSYADGEVVTAPGELFRTTCNWNNTTGEELMFPHEMCVAVGLAYPMEEPILCDPK